MSHIHCEMHNKLSKTMGVTIGVYGINNYFTVPLRHYLFKTVFLDSVCKVFVEHDKTIKSFCQISNHELGSE